MLFVAPFTLLLFVRSAVHSQKRAQSKTWQADDSALHSIPSTHEISASLKDAYNDKGIEGFLDLCYELKITSIYEPKELVQAALQVPSKGIASGILNAMIASCLGCGDESHHLSISDAGGDMLMDEHSLKAMDKEVETGNAQTALRILQAYDEAAIADEVPINTMTPTAGPSRPAFALIPDVVTLALTYAASFQSYPRIANKILARAEYPNKVPRQVEHGERSILDPGIEILRDSEDYMIINKPSGLVLKKETWKAKSKKRIPKDSPSLEQILFKYCMVQNDNSQIWLSLLNPDGSRGFVHQLDCGTSGCLVVAMSNQGHAQLLAQSFSVEWKSPTSPWSTPTWFHFQKIIWKKSSS